MPKAGSFTTQALIGGEVVPALDGKTTESVNPATGRHLADIADCGTADIDKAVKSARISFESGSWSRRSPAERKGVLLEFADLIEKNTTELAMLDTLDAGKPITDTTDIDIPETARIIRWYAELADKVFGKISPTGPENLGLILRESVGVVGAILPWNYPAIIAALKIGPALAAGNSVVVKPPEQAPLSAIRIGQLALEAGIPPGVLNVVPGRGETAGRALALHNDVDALTFTGSTSVGRLLLGYSAESNLKRVVLELGGKSPQIVMADAMADKDYVAEQLAFAAFYNGGQNCTCGSRVLVQASARDELIESLVAASRSWTVGDPTDAATRVGAIIERPALDRILNHVDGAVADGAQVVTGGKRVLQQTGGWFIEPTIVDDVRNDMRIAQEEVFGPVVSVVTFETEEEAIKLANDTTYGLAASVFTRDIDAAFRLSRAVRAGTVSVNSYSEGDISTPFGGHRQSGFGGHDMGTEALDQYTELKTIWLELKA